jgi:threonine synthase
MVGRRASVVAIITGNGLKDVQSARSAVTQPFDIAPDGDGLPDVLRRQELIS